MTDAQRFNKAHKTLKRLYYDCDGGGYKAHLFVIISKMNDVLEEMGDDEA